jgi:methyl-accepting chemotaxis protein-1 (serine sensor receptor)
MASAAAKSLAGGDLSFTLDVSGRDDLSSLLSSLESTRQNVARMAAVVQQDAARMAVVAGDIANENAELADRTSAQAAALEQSAAAIAGFTSIAEENAGRGAEGEKLGYALSLEADQMQDRIASAVRAIHEIRADVVRIASITGTVDGIASQTSLLALNAAIQAAKAGHHGRGFAVVAGEVRKLATRVADAAREIAGLTSAAQAKSQQGVQHAELAFNDMEHLVDAVRQLARTNATVHSASLEQKGSAQELNASVSSVASLTQRNAERVDALAVSTKALHSRARNVLAATQRFRQGTREHAIRMVSAAAAYIDEVGLTEACREFTSGEAFKELDLYVVAYDFRGTNLAQGADATMVGKNMFDLHDANGVPIVRRLISIASEQGRGWLEGYTFPNPVTGAMDRKSMYVQRTAGDVMVGCGVYGS